MSYTEYPPEHSISGGNIDSHPDGSIEHSHNSDNTFSTENLGEAQNENQSQSQNQNQNFDHPIDTLTLQSETNFIDLLSTDMDFEQAYLMFSSLQDNNNGSSANALNSFDQLQMLNQQYSTSLDAQSHHQLAGDHAQTSLHSPSRRIQNNIPQYNFSQAYHPSVASGSGSSSASSSGLGITAGNTNSAVGSTALPYHGANAEGFDANKNYSFSNAKQSLQRNEDEEELDTFFSSTESDALEKFLDNLANPNGSTNPLQFYYNNLQHPQSQQKNFKANGNQDYMYDLYTMKPEYKSQTQPQTRMQDHEHLKKELTEAFSHPSLKLNTASPSQLPTPSDSRQSSSTSFDDINGKNNKNNANSNIITPPGYDSNERKHGYSEEDEEDEDDDTQHKKRRRSSQKPLLSLEQKRLNHSHSEQKRRQLCKLAYQRCLRQIIDIEAFNRLPAISEEQRKSKRARVNKEGLPNLSKHNALIRISNEIMLIQSLNEGIRSLIDQK